MENYSRSIEALTAMTKVKFLPASNQDLKKLANMGLPQMAIEFYATYAPMKTVEHRIRLWPVDEVIEENTELLPGCVVSQYGYFVFASSLTGDAYCFDTNNCDKSNNPQIVHISHETVSEDTTPAEIAQFAFVVAQNLCEFLRKLTESDTFPA